MLLMLKGSKVVFVAFTQHCIQSNVTHLTHVERVKSAMYFEGVEVILTFDPFDML